MTGYTFDQLVDLEQARALFESHNRLSGMAYGLFDPHENNLIAVGWQDICMKFHRVNPVTCARCRESDAFIKAHLHDADGELLEYHCKNNMIDIAMPVIIDGVHLATFFTGQFFYDDAPPDRDFFVRQAGELGFDQKAYLDALDRVPSFSHEHIRGNVMFLHNMVQVLAEMGLKNLRLAREMEERKRVEDALRSSEEKYRRIVDTANEGIWVLGVDAATTFVNARMAEMVGYASEEMLGRPYSDFLFEEDLADNQSKLERRSHGISENYERRFRHKDGRTVWAIVSAAPIFDEGGHFAGSFGMIADITERKQVEEALRENEERLRILADFTYDWEYWEGPDHNIWYVTPSCERVTGYTREAFMANPELVYQIIHPDDRHLMEKHRKDVLHEDRATVDFRIVRRDGEIRWIAHGCRAVYWHGDKYMGRRASNRDVTERKLLEMKLGELNKTLEHRVEDEVAKNRDKDHMLIQQSRLAAMGEMVHNIAHQWRQPLTSLAILLTNIKDDYDYRELTEESLSRAVQTGCQILQGMSTTVDDFRDFFRPDREPSEFDMGQAVESALFVIKAALANNHIDVEKNLAGGLMAYGYHNQFSQAILNVLANAKEAIQHHMRSGGRIRLSLGRTGDQGILSIEDNGGGIPAEVLPKIFDPYFTTKDKGSGIGLYMAKMIVERNLNGKITAGNTGEGACITFSLPLLDKNGGA